ncbi:MAG TPA: adenylate/guanylate cyclase domain-containing protein [Mycobacteriales bacterium]|nr:adenylate/guanylate cyclase domain-containing protein [Mycobacteriales bacterium]
MDPAPTRYVDRDGAALAYQVFGDGPRNLLAYADIVQHPDLCWTDPDTHHNLQRMAEQGRTVFFQRRGLGLSEPVPYVPTIEQQADDILAVMDAAGMGQALLFGVFDACPALAMVAACAPERVAGLFLAIPFADGVPIDDHIPVGWSEQEAAAFAADNEAAMAGWGSGLSVRVWDAVADTPYNRRLMGLLERCSATPAAARAHFEWYSRIDLTDVLRAIQVPTYVMRQATNRLPEAVVRHVAELIPSGTYQSLPGVAPGASLGEGLASVLDFNDEILSGADSAVPDGRSLATILFTDIVGSTELLARLGDGGYRKVRDTHERQVHLAVEQAKGRLVKVLGDGTLSVFDGPSRAVRCADTIRGQARDLGLEIRAGVHTGEVERRGPDVAGMTVHISARVSAAAGPGEILVSRTVRDLVVGSGLDFADRGEHQLKGVPGSWQLFAVDSAARHPEAVEIEPSMLTLADRAAVAAARRTPGAVRTAMRIGNSIQRRRLGRSSTAAPV